MSAAPAEAIREPGTGTSGSPVAPVMGVKIQTGSPRKAVCTLLLSIFPKPTTLLHCSIFVAKNKQTNKQTNKKTGPLNWIWSTRSPPWLVLRKNLFVGITVGLCGH